MKIAIVGTRGIPNHYSGFEQFAEYFSVYLAEKGHDVYVYNSHNHLYQEKTFKGVNLIHKYDPEYKLGTFGQFIYDYNCITDSRKHNFDVILQLGYTSNSIWYFLMPKKPVNIINMDGLEWKRSKYSPSVQKFLKFAEKLAANNTDYMVADSLGIQSYLKSKYNKDSQYIPYGAHPFTNPDDAILKDYGVQKGNYNMIIARFEPENNIDMVLQGIVDGNDKTTMLVVGNNTTKYGEFLKAKYANYNNIVFTGGIFNISFLNNLRYYSKLYFHGHSVGGTNPSLLEAMASKAFIIAHNNDFNRAILKDNAYYFSNSGEAATLLTTLTREENLQKIENNYTAIVHDFNWEKINGEYLQFFEACFIKKNRPVSG